MTTTLWDPGYAEHARARGQTTVGPLQSRIIIGAAFVCALSLFGGCSHIDVQAHVVPPPTPKLAVAIEAVDVSWESGGYGGHLRAEDLNMTLWADSRWLALPPRAWVMMDPSDPDLLKATDLVARARVLGLSARDMAVLRTTVTLQQVSASPRKGAAPDSSYLIGFELLDMASQVLAAVSVTVPFTPEPQASSEREAHPELRAALLAGVRELIVRCSDCLQAWPRPDFAVEPGPSVVLEMSRDDGVRLKERLRTAGPATGDALLWRNIRYFRPGVALQEVRQLVDRPPGQCLQGGLPVGFRDGDCIVRIERFQADNPHLIALYLQRHGFVRLEVRDFRGVRRVVRYRLPN